MTRMMVVIGVAGCIALGAATQAVSGDGKPEQRAPKGTAKTGRQKPAGELKAMVLRGTLIKQETEKKGQKLVVYQMKQADGVTVRLPRLNGVEYDEFVNREILITGEGTEVERRGKKAVWLKSITDVRLPDVEAGEPVEQEKMPEEEPDTEAPDVQDGDGLDDAG